MFAKIFETIFDSSIADDWETRIVFQDMLVLSDKHGILDRTPAAIARRTNLPLALILRAIPILEGPDPSSRTPDHAGARIIRLDEHRDWGWRIVNFVKYRESATKEMLRMAEAERKKAYRDRQLHFPSPKPPTLQNQKQRAEAEKSLDMSGTSGVIQPQAQGLSPLLSLPDRITSEKSITRIDKRLEALAGADDAAEMAEAKRLRIEKKRLLDVLGLKA